VLILVKVAIIQVKNLKIEAEKGFKRTLFELELVDPDLEINFVKDDAELPKVHRFFINAHLHFIEREIL